MKRISKVVVAIVIGLGVLATAQPLYQLTIVADSTIVSLPAAIKDVFIDPNLAEVIRVQLGKSSVDEVVTQDELNTIMQLTADYKQISDITGVRYLNNVTRLMLAGNNITNMDEFLYAHMPNLVDISFDHNKITSIDGLKNLTALKSMSFHNNQITNIDVFTQMNVSQLETLVLGLNKISSIDGLKNMDAPKLSVLYLDDNNIPNIDALATINAGTNWSLSQLALEKNRISDISVLGNMNLSNVRALYLADNKISDISILGDVNTDMPALFYFTASNQKIELTAIEKSATVSITNKVKDNNGILVGADLVSNGGLYTTPNVEWDQLAGTETSVQYTFGKTIPFFGNTREANFSGVVTQPLIDRAMGSDNNTSDNNSGSNVSDNNIVGTSTSNTSTNNTQLPVTGQADGLLLVGIGSLLIGSGIMLTRKR